MSAKNVIITRSYEDNAILAPKIAELNLNSISSPMIAHKILPCDFAQFESYKNLIITSKFAAQIVAEHYLHNVDAYVVGDESAEVLRKNEKVRVMGVYDDVASLQHPGRHSALDAERYALYLSGNHITAEIPFADRHIIYNAEYAMAISSEALDIIAQNQANFLMFYSKNSAQNFIDLIKPHIHLQNLQNSVVIAISKEVGDVVRTYVEDVLVPEKPSAAGMLELLEGMKG